jgi:hypothetical protein
LLCVIYRGLQRITDAGYGEAGEVLDWLLDETEAGGE